MRFELPTLFTVLDHFIKRELRCKGYVRFVDDLLLFGEEKAQLWEWKTAVAHKLAALRLTMHPHAQPHAVQKGIPFLGFRIYPQKRRLKRRKVVHFRRRLKGKIAAYAAGELSFDDLTASVQGWVNHARFGNTVGVRKAVLGEAVIPKRNG